MVSAINYILFLVTWSELSLFSQPCQNSNKYKNLLPNRDSQAWVILITQSMANLQYGREGKIFFSPCYLLIFLLYYYDKRI